MAVWSIGSQANAKPYQRFYLPLKGMAIAQTLHILLLEDAPLDIELIQHHLQQGGINGEVVSVSTREEFIAAIENNNFQLILADYALPTFDGLTALNIARQKCPDVPFIIVSGVLGEELAIDTLKRGVTDYILKKRLERLAPCVKRALQETQMRQERQQALDELKSSEERFRQVFTNAPIGIVLVAPDGHIEQSNRAFREMLGYSASELCQLSFQDIVHPDDWEAALSQREQLLQGESTNLRFQKRYRTKSGEVIWIQHTCGVLHNAAGEIQFIVTMVENITERRKLERMKESFVSVVSHEMRTPLSSLRGALGLLATGQLGALQAEGQELLDIALTESSRLERLVNDVMDLERIKISLVPLVKQSCQITDLIMQVETSIRPLAEQANITLIVLPTSAVVQADPDRIIQTLFNLVNNAIKFSPEGSTLRLAARLVEPQELEGKFEQNITETAVLFEVEDQGRGIPADKLEAIFSPFEQIDDSDSRQQGGTGLGLAICRSIIEQHGGQIWAESVLGEGSRFYFTLPLT